MATADQPSPQQPAPQPPGSPPASTPPAWLPHTAWVAGAFCLLIGLVLLGQHFRARSADPWKSPALTELHNALRAAPKDEAVKERIRALDLESRQRYFRHLAATRTGGWLLLAAAVAFFATARATVAARAQPHFPRLVPDAAERQARTLSAARTAGLATAALAILVLASLALSRPTPLPPDIEDIDEFLARLAGSEDDGVGPPPSQDEVGRNWPRFLGPTGNAFTTNSALPLDWDIAAAKNLLWKSPLPDPGFNSPLVWSNHVFLSGGDSTQRVVCAFDLGSGALLWRTPITNVPGSPAQLPKVPASTGFAASTMATDGRRAFAIFASGDLAALRFDGKIAWSRNLGLPKNQYGHAASLALWQARLIVQLDQGEAEQARSRLYAFDPATGRTLWEKTRPTPESWASPVIAPTPNPFIVTLGGQWAIAYALKDGTELWRADVLIGEVAPSPIFVNGLVLVPSPNDKLVAIRPDGQGDVTKTHIAWTAEDNLPDITSPVSNGELVFIVSTPGMLTCYELKSGKKLWDQDLGFEVNASPAIAGPHLLVLGKTGAALIALAAPEFKALARRELGEPVFASPALVQNRVVIRTATSLLCLGPATQAAAAAAPPQP
jgi:outer membrane protein assembly factor BamB